MAVDLIVIDVPVGNGKNHDGIGADLFGDSRFLHRCGGGDLGDADDGRSLAVYPSTRFLGNRDPLLVRQVCRFSSASQRCDGVDIGLEQSIDHRVKRLHVDSLIGEGGDQVADNSLQVLMRHITSWCQVFTSRCISAATYLPLHGVVRGEVDD